MTHNIAKIDNYSVYRWLGNKIIYFVSYKWRSIALILIMHVYKCMQIPIGFRQYNKQNLSSFTSLT